MNRPVLISLLMFMANLTFSQQKAFIHIFEEQTYPAQAYTTIAQKQQYSWTINGKEIKYKTGKYDITINDGDKFDTIKFQKIFKSTELNSESVQITRYDTTQKLILCKFRENHNYKIGQLLPDHFEIYALDTFETQTNIILKVINNKKKDTLYLYNTYPERKLFSDTTITILNKNEKMKQSFLQHIELSKAEREIWFDESGKNIPKNNIFELYYNFLQAENLEIEFDLSTNKYKLRLLGDHTDSLGIDNNNILNKFEVNYFDSIFKGIPYPVVFKGIKVLFLDGRSEIKLITKKEFFDLFIKPSRNKHEIPNFSTSNLSKEEKQRSGGYDVIFISPSGTLTNKAKKKILKQLPKEKKD